MTIEKSDFLYFTHQSFQEYFAACYVKKKQAYVDIIVKQQWNPKWKEVIKFLAGLIGIDFVRRIYSGKDNVIHARLFLSIECLGEIKNGMEEYIEKLQKDLNKIPYQSPFVQPSVQRIIKA